MGGNQEPMTPPPAAPQPAPPAASGPSALDSLVASMGMTQLLILGGALVLLGVDIVLGLLARQYYIGDMAWFASAAIVLTYLFGRRPSSMVPFAYQTVLLVGGLIIAIVGIRGIAIDLMSVLTSPSAWDAIELIGLVLYSGAVIAVAWGTWLLLRGQR